MTLLNPCKLLMKFNQQKAHTIVPYFCVKLFMSSRNDVNVCGVAVIFPAIMMPNFTEKIRKRKITQPAFTCSKLTIETLEQGVKYVQS